jgi:hypothetical protein
VNYGVKGSGFYVMAKLPSVCKFYKKLITILIISKDIESFKKIDMKHRYQSNHVSYHDLFHTILSCDKNRAYRNREANPAHKQPVEALGPSWQVQASKLQTKNFSFWIWNFSSHLEACSSMEHTHPSLHT